MADLHSVSHEMKDWPHALRLNAAVAVLGQGLYYARCEAYGIPPVAWADVPFSLRRQLESAAKDVLIKLKPVPRQEPRCTSCDCYLLACSTCGSRECRVCHPHVCTKVIARITPDEPYGLSIHDGERL